MTLADKMKIIEGMLTVHFATLPPEERASTAKIMDNLRNMGATSDHNIAELSPSDLEAAGVPVLIAKRAAKAIGWVAGEGQKQIVILDDNPVNLAARLKPEELVDQYDPNDPTSPYGMRLKQISGDARFLVFDREGIVNVSVSQKLLREILDGYSQRATVMVDGKPEELFAVGERPARYAHENPAAPGTMLRPDGFSDLNIEWGVIPQEVQQLVFIAVKNGESKKAEVDLFDDVVGQKFNDVARRFPQASVQFEKLKGAESLPSLRIILQPKKKEPAK